MTARLTWIIGLIPSVAAGQAHRSDIPEHTIEQRIEDGVAIMPPAQDCDENWLTEVSGNSI
jgi:hypothetical protein